MKIALYVLLVLQTLATGISFIMLLPTSILWATVMLVLGALNLVPILAILSHVEQIDNLQYRVDRLQTAVKQLQDRLLPEVDAEPVALPEETARNTWECVKCGTVNKGGTTRCAHCGGAYSAWINPTDNPYVKKKVSRWIKK